MKCETKWKKRLKQGMISIPDNSGTNIDVGKKISGASSYQRILGIKTD
jgi:hypothetical protein